MAWVVTSVVDAVDEANGTSWTIPSISLDADSLFYLALGASDQGGATEIVVPSASGLTFELVASDLSGSTGLGVYIAQVDSDGFTGTIDVDVPSGTTQHEVLLYWGLQITGHDSSDPVVRFITARDTATELELDLGVADSADSALHVSAYLIQSAQAITPTEGWDSVSSTLQSSSTPARSMRLFTKEGIDESQVASWTSSTTARGVLIEFAAGDSRSADVSFAEIEVPSVSSDNRADVSFAEMQVPDVGVPATLQWEQSDLDGGGALNAVATSDDGTWLLAGSDISGARSSTDGGVTWVSKNKGLPDGLGAVGGLCIKPGSTTEAILLCESGLFYTSDQADTWTRVSSAVTFGSDGSRPRQNVGHIVDSIGNFAYMIDAAGRVHRFLWSTQALTQSIVTLTGIGEAVVIDPVNPTIVYAGTRSGVWRITSAQTTATATAFTGGSTPVGVRDLAIASVGTVVYLFAAEMGVGIKRSNGSATAAWSNISPSGQSTCDWQTVTAATVGSSVILAALCQNAPEIENGKFAQYWYSNSAQNTTPVWTSPLNLVNAKGGPGGDPWWASLGTAAGGKAALDSNTPIRDSNHSGEDARWFLRGGVYWLIVAGQQGAFLLDRTVNEIYPAMERLGTAEINRVEADPNTPGRFFAPSRDQGFMITNDLGETWSQSINGLPAGTVAAHDMAFDAALSPAQLFVAHGDKSTNTLGGVYFHPNPFSYANWVNLNLGEEVAGITYGPIPNTDANPTPDHTYDITGKTASQITSQLNTYGNGAKVRLTGTGPGGWDVDSNNQVIFGPAIINANGSNDGITVWGTGNTLSDLEVKNAIETGILVKSTANDTLLRRCYTHHNDQRGIGGNGNHEPNWGVVVDTCTIEENGYNGLRLGNNQGGMKWVQVGRPGQENSSTSSLWVKNCTSFHNRGNGIWADIACAGLTFEHNECYENVRSGFSFEISADGTLQYNLSYDNGTWPGESAGEAGGWGFKCVGNAYIDIDNNKLYGNTDGAVLVDENWRSDIPGGPDFEDAGEPGIFYPALATTGKGYAIELARVRHNVVENGTSMPASAVKGGIKNTNYSGEILIDTTPPSGGGTTSLGGAVPYGLEVFRAANPQESGSPTRRFIYAGFEGVGLVRQIMSTSATSPTKIEPLETISSTVCSSRPAAQRHEIVWMDNDTLLVWDFTRGVYIVKSARGATPTIWQAWAVTNDAPIGENFIARIDSDSALISVGSGASKGVYLLEDISTATNGQQFGVALGRTSISRPGGGSWSRPGPVAFSDGQAVISELKALSYPAGDNTIWVSTSAPYTGSYSEITNTTSDELLHDIDGIAVDADGTIMVSMGGAGVASYRLLGGEPGDDDRFGQLSWVEIELPNAPRRLDLSWAEAQLPDAARIAHLSFAEMEAPEFDRIGQISWVELEVPINSTYRSVEVAFAEMQLDDAPRSARVSWAELETPDEFIQNPEGAVYVGMSGRILVPIRWRLRRPFRR